MGPWERAALEWVLPAMEKTPLQIPAQQGGVRWVWCLSFYFAFWPKPLSHQSRHCAGTRTLLPVNSGHYHGLKPLAVCLDLFDVDLVIVVVCWNQLSLPLPFLSFLLLLPIPQGGIPQILRSILLFSSCNRWTWMSSQGLQFQAPLAIRCGYDWVLFQGEVSSCDVGGKDQWDLGNIWERNITIGLALWMPVWTRTPAHVKYFPGLTVWGRNFNCIWNMIYLSQFVTTQLPLLTDTFHYALSLETCLAYIFSLWAS